MTQDERRAFLGFVFSGKFEDIALTDGEFIFACSSVQRCDKHGYHLEQEAKKLDNDRIC